MSVSLHDTHFHLDLFDNPTQVLDRIERDEIFTIAVTNVPAVFEHTFKLAEKSKYVRAALGFHPELAARHKQQLSLFLELLQKTRYIGEIGLDNYKKSDADYATQIKIFEQLIYACDQGWKKNHFSTFSSRRNGSYFHNRPEIFRKSNPSLVFGRFKRNRHCVVLWFLLFCKLRDDSIGKRQENYQSTTHGKNSTGNRRPLYKNRKSALNSI